MFRYSAILLIGPAADPGYPPAIDPVAQRDGLGEPQELGADVHASCMALLARTVKAAWNSLAIIPNIGHPTSG